jgi:prolipoprotein diacylglyceryltransferase
LVAQTRNSPGFDVTDFIAPLVPLGLAAGRIGNFINGELWGRVADPSLPWAMIFPQGRRHAAAPSVAALSRRARRFGTVCNLTVAVSAVTATRVAPHPASS